jgi:hypothetical protein
MTRRNSPAVMGLMFAVLAGMAAGSCSAAPPARPAAPAAICAEACAARTPAVTAPTPAAAAQGIVPDTAAAAAQGIAPAPARPTAAAAQRTVQDTAGVEELLRLLADAPQFKSLPDSSIEAEHRAFVLRALQARDRYEPMSGGFRQHGAAAGHEQAGQAAHTVQSTASLSRMVEAVRSADFALLWVESRLGGRRAPLRVRHSTPGFHVQYIRWRDRHDRRVIWSSVYSDTTISVSAAAYRFRYRDPQTGRDTVVDLPCADGCRVPVGR